MCFIIVFTKSCSQRNPEIGDRRITESLRARESLLGDQGRIQQHLSYPDGTE